MNVLNVYDKQGIANNVTMYIHIDSTVSGSCFIGSNQCVPSSVVQLYIGHSQ